MHPFTLQLGSSITSVGNRIFELHLENYFRSGPDYILSPSWIKMFQLSPLPFSLWTASVPATQKRAGLGLGCGLSIVYHLCRFYHTRGHYPGHRMCFHLDLVDRALGLPRNLTVLPPVPLKTCLSFRKTFSPSYNKRLTLRYWAIKFCILNC